MQTNWKSVKLGDLFTFKNGLNKGVEFFGHGTPIVNYMDVNKNSFLTSDSVKGLVEVSTAELNNCGALKGDVFFTRTSETLDEIGLSSVLVDDIDDCVFSGYVLRARPRSDELIPKYCAYSLRIPSIRKEIMRKSSMTTRALTNGRFLADVDYAYPDTSEQKRIVAILEVWDDYAKNLAEEIRLKKRIKKGLTQSLLSGKKRLPGFSDDWHVKALEHFGSATIGLTYSPKDVVEENGTLVFRSTNIQDGKIDYDSQVRVSSNVPSRLMMREGDILICARNGSRRLIGKSAYVTKDDEGNTFGAFMSVFRCKNPKYMYQLFQSDQFRKEVTRDLGPTINQVTTGHLMKYKFIFPPEAEQAAIVEILDNADLEIQLLEQKKKYADRQRKYLLNNLVSGSIKIPAGLTVKLKEASNA